MPPAPPAASANPAAAGTHRGRPARLQPGTALPAFAAAALLVLGTAIYTQANLLFWLFGLSVGGALFAFAHGSVSLRGVTVHRLPPARSEAGQPLSIGYEVRNAGPIGCLSLRIRETGAPRGPGAPGPGAPAERLPWAWVARVDAGETVRVAAEGVAPPRGEHPLGGIEVSTTFPLGLFRRRRVFDLPGVLRVLPRMTPLAPDAVTRAAQPRPGPDGVSARATPGVEGDFYGSRGYRPGDPLRTLDWKRSARQGELMVRELATPEPPRVVLVLDLRDAESRGERSHRADPAATAPAEAEEEQAISLAASLVSRAHAAGFRVGLRVLGLPCPAFTAHHAPAHRDRLLGALGRIDLSARRDPAAVPPRAARESTVFVSPGPAGGAAPRLRFAAAGRGGRGEDGAAGVGGAAA